MELKARGSQTLEDHLNEVARISEKIVNRKKLSSPLLNEEEIATVARIVGLTHDFGKGMNFFQKYLSSECSDPKPKKKRHSSISAFYTYHVLKEKGFTDLVATIGWQIVQRHHGDLTNLLERSSDGKFCEIERKTDPSSRSLIKDQMVNIEDNTLDKLREVYERLNLDYTKSFFEAIKSGKIFEEVKFNKIKLKQDLEVRESHSPFYLMLFLYSVLLDADQTNSAGLDFDKWPSVGYFTCLDSDIIEFYKKEELSINSELDEQREEAFNKVSSYIGNESRRLLSLTLPTGGGKTLTALNAALKVRNGGEFERPPRIIYSLPFLSIIDQNFGVITDILSTNKIETKPSVILRHDYKSGGFSEDGLEEEFLDREVLLTEGWNSEMITTTFVQFFETLIATKKSKARKFHKMTNSIILLDEIQAVPVKYWGVIKEGINILTNEFNSYVILLTATNPLIFEPGKEIKEMAPDFKKYFEYFDRIDYSFHMDGETLPEMKARVLDKIGENSQKDVMVVLNTVKSSKKLFEELENEVSREIIYLSTNILPKHREERINEIKESDEPILIITTQLVEAGVDIDIDLVYRDFAPLDSIVQVAGRCNREDEGERGEVHIFKLKDEDGMRDYYYQYIYDSVLLDITQDILSEFGGGVSESEFNLEAIRKYFDQVNEKKSLNPDEILEDLSKLSCGDVSFSLISEDYQTVSVFLEIDQDASNIYNEVKKVCEECRGYTRKGKLLNLKSDFYSYILDVKVRGNEDILSHLPETTFFDDMRKVSKNQIERWYDEEIGFQFPESTVEDRLL